jgi:cytochrome c oxidase assembly factor CtaG
MDPVVQAVLLSWSIPAAATFTLLLTAATYLRGTWLLRRAGYPLLPAWRISSFLVGLFALWFALASPLDTFSGFVLTAHMLQHMMLMMLAPPLLLLGEPLIPIVRGMPRFAAREFAGPFLNWHIADRIGLTLTKPVVALLLLGTVVFVWHVPGPYELAVRSSSWHQVEHACFFFASLVFWWPVVQSWPSRPQWPRWAMVPYLVVADLQNTLLSAVLVFSDRVLYPSYAAGPNLFGFPPLEDQAAAGAIMWVVGSLAFLVPSALIAVQCLSPRSSLRGARVPRRQPSKAVDQAVATSLTDRKLDSLVGHPAPRRSSDAVTFLLLFVAVAIGLAYLLNSGSDDDDQVLRHAQAAGDFNLAVFAPEGKLPAGSATFAVLVQRRDSHEVQLDSEVNLRLLKADGSKAEQESQPARRDGENRLLFAAAVDLPSPGAWILQVEVQRSSQSASVSLPIEVVRPEGGSAIPWSHIVILAFATVLGVTYLYRHRRSPSRGLVAPVP